MKTPCRCSKIDNMVPHVRSAGSPESGCWLYFPITGPQERRHTRRKAGKEGRKRAGRTEVITACTQLVSKHTPSGTSRGGLAASPADATRAREQEGRGADVGACPGHQGWHLTKWSSFCSEGRAGPLWPRDLGRTPAPESRGPRAAPTLKPKRGISPCPKLLKSLLVCARGTKCCGQTRQTASPCPPSLVPTVPGLLGIPAQGLRRVAGSPGAAVPLHVRPTGGSCRRLPKGQLGRPHRGTDPMSSQLKMRPVSRQDADRT